MDELSIFLYVVPVNGSLRWNYWSFSTIDRCVSIWLIVVSFHFCDARKIKIPCESCKWMIFLATMKMIDIMRNGCLCRWLKFLNTKSQIYSKTLIESSNRIRVFGVCFWIWRLEYFGIFLFQSICNYHNDFVLAYW